MGQNRSERQPLTANTPVLAEVLRQAAEAGKPEGGDEENRIPLFWRVFGGTVLSITALVVMTAYQGFTSSLKELSTEIGHLEKDMRKEMAQFRESQGGLIRKDEFNGRMQSVWKSMKDLEEDRKQLAELKERCETLMQRHRTSITERRQLEEEIRLVREQQAMSQERQALRSELSQLRERLAGIEGQQVVKPAVRIRSDH